MEKFPVKFVGILEIYDITTSDKSLVVKNTNSIHLENMSLALAQSLTRKNVAGVYVGPIKKLVFGNGGTSVNGVGVITYLNKNTTGESASLYNQTYEKIVDQNNPQNVDVTRNYLDAVHVPGNLFSDILVVCTLEFGEPAGQQVVDATTNINDNFVFDEFGLVNYDGKLLSHVLVSPVQKSANRIWQINYTIRVLMV